VLYSELLHSVRMYVHVWQSIYAYLSFVVTTFVQVSFVFIMFVTAMRQKPHYYVIPIPNVIILYYLGSFTQIVT